MKRGQKKSGEGRERGGSVKEARGEEVEEQEGQKWYVMRKG